MTTATDFAKQLSRFLSEYLPHERNVSPNTLSAYRDAFVQYIDFMHTQRVLQLRDCVSSILHDKTFLGTLIGYLMRGTALQPQGTTGWLPSMRL